MSARIACRTMYKDYYLFRYFCLSLFMFRGWVLRAGNCDFFSSWKSKTHTQTHAEQPSTGHWIRITKILFHRFDKFSSWNQTTPKLRWNIQMVELKSFHCFSSWAEWEMTEGNHQPSEVWWRWREGWKSVAEVNNNSSGFLPPFKGVSKSKVIS